MIFELGIENLRVLRISCSSEQEILFLCLNVWWKQLIVKIASFPMFMN